MLMARVKLMLLLLLLLLLSERDETRIDGFTGIIVASVISIVHVFVILFLVICMRILNVVSILLMLLVFFSLNFILFGWLDRLRCFMGWECACHWCDCCRC